MSPVREATNIFISFKVNISNFLNNFTNNDNKCTYQSLSVHLKLNISYNVKYHADSEILFTYDLITVIYKYYTYVYRNAKILKLISLTISALENFTEEPVHRLRFNGNTYKPLHFN